MVKKIATVKEKFEEVVVSKKDVVINSPTEVKSVDYTAIGAININNKIYGLLAGSDNKWYKQEISEMTRIDPRNNTPEIAVWNPEVTELTKTEFDAAFIGQNKKKK